MGGAQRGLPREGERLGEHGQIAKWHGQRSPTFAKCLFLARYSYQYVVS